MSTLFPNALALWLAQLFTAIFLAILFLQSGMDKVTDRAGNMGWLQGHFAKTPFKNMVGLMVTMITLLELAAGLLSAIGVGQLIVSHTSGIAFWGAVTSALTLICLFFGQRMAKDYAGAAVLVPYFLLSMVALMLLQ
mgnify:CR=1 FL=1